MLEPYLWLQLNGKTHKTFRGLLQEIGRFHILIRGLQINNYQSTKLLQTSRLLEEI